MILPSSVFHLLRRPPPDRGVLARDLYAPGKPGSASPLGNGRPARALPLSGIPASRLPPAHALSVYRRRVNGSSVAGDLGRSPARHPAEARDLVVADDEIGLRIGAPGSAAGELFRRSPVISGRRRARHRG